MKKIIDIENWNRKEHFHFFSKFSEPFFGVTVKIECSTAYAKAKEKQVSFFFYYLYRALKAANQIDNFKYRIIDNQAYEFDTVNASPTINRPNGTFGFAYMDFDEDEENFFTKAMEEIEKVQSTNSLLPAVSGENVIHFSAIPISLPQVCLRGLSLNISINTGVKYQKRCLLNLLKRQLQIKKMISELI